MAHIHGVFDSDAHLVINPTTRAIKSNTPEKTTIMQHDHNSERFTFELPKEIEGHDMSKCNEVQVHYLNTDSQTRAVNKGVYKVEDLQISPEDENTLIGSWLISGNATKLVGKLDFILRFACITDGVIDYAWHTDINSDYSVGKGINNGEAVVTEYADILEQWKKELEELAASGGSGSGGSGTPGKDGISPTVEITATEGGHTVTVTDAKGAKSFDVMDGKDGADGKSAYQYAKDGGFTGSEAEFAELLANGTSSPSDGTSSPSGEANTINPDLNLLVFGDSIFGTSTGKSWIKSLGCKVVNYAVSGATLAQISDARYKNGAYNNIQAQFDKFVADVAAEKAAGKASGEGTLAFHEPDMILIDGGANDYMNASVMGTLVDYPDVNDTSTTFDEKTVTGAIGNLFRDITIAFPQAQKFYLMLHKVNQCTKYTPLKKYPKLGYKYWAKDKTYVRVFHTPNLADHPDVDPAGDWKIIHASGSRKITASEIAETSTIYVKDFYEPDVTGASDEQLDYQAATIDKESLYINGELDTSKLEGGYTFDELREKIINACNAYSFKVIDIYNNSPLNVAIAPTTERTLIDVNGDLGFESVHADEEGNYSGISIGAGYTTNLMKNPFPFPNLYLFDWKGIHPTTLGYQVGYDPLVRQALCKGTKK